MTQVQVETLVRVDGRLAPLSAMPAKLVDDGDLPVIEGGVTLVVDGVRVLSADMWDDVDSLWAYIIDGVADALDGKPFRTSFPDGDTPIEIDPLDLGRLRFAVGRTGDDHRAEVVVEAGPFARAIAEGGEAFWRQVEARYPDYDTSWVRSRIARLRAV